MSGSVADSISASWGWGAGRWWRRVSTTTPASCLFPGSLGLRGAFLKIPIDYQALSFHRQTLTSPSDSVLCVIEIQHSLFSSDTKYCPTVKSKPVCCPRICIFFFSLSYDSACWLMEALRWVERGEIGLRPTLDFSSPYSSRMFPPLPYIRQCLLVDGGSEVGRAVGPTTSIGFLQPLQHLYVSSTVLPTTVPAGGSRP